MAGFPSMSRSPGTLHSSISRRQSPHLAVNRFARTHSLSATSRLSVYVARPTRSIRLCCDLDTLRGSWHRPKFPNVEPAFREFELLSILVKRKTSERFEVRIPSCVASSLFLPSAFFLLTLRVKRTGGQNSEDGSQPPAHRGLRPGGQRLGGEEAPEPVIDED